MSHHRLLRLLLPVVAALLAIGCSSGSSGGGSPTASGSSGGSPPAIDKHAVDSLLDTVLTGLRTATGISRSNSIHQAAHALQSAAADLHTAGDALNPPPAGVPETTAVPVSTGLLRVSTLLGEASTCLARQQTAKVPSTKRCLPPLRRAEARDASIAHGLIRVSAYGSKSPKKFERQLAAALRGH